MKTITINGTDYQFSSLFICASGAGYVPAKNFWNLWKEFPEACKRAGVKPIRDGGEWLVTIAG